MTKIYRITNIMNGKIYIGKTTRTLQERLNAHWYDKNRRDTYFYFVLREAKKENFKIDLIEEVLDELSADREDYWMNYYHSYHPDFGYNSNRALPSSKEFDLPLAIAFHELGYDIHEISEKVNWNFKAVSSHLNSVGIKPNRKSNFWIVAMNKDFEEIDKFNTTTAAAKWCEQQGSKVKPNSIQSAIGKSTRSGGYYWKKVLKLEYNAVKAQEQTGLGVP